ncbi:MAG: hypothetical protein HYS80_02475 [Candidatus Aenigmarchaeota archaeon]|nr:hypothetical protein [Candidatus Aenigmarchaeota archaeon]
MDFPKQTLELAERVAGEIRRINGNEPARLGEEIYTHLKGRFGYGFWEGMRQGLFIRYPHEIQDQWECIEAAVYTYVLAEALSLQPRMHSVRNWNELNTGHETVDIKVNGDRVLVDPLNYMFGRVDYTNKAIRVEDNELTERCILPCKPIDEVPRERILQRMEYYRSDEGIVNLLRAGQSAHVSNIHTLFFIYNPKSRRMTYQMRIHPPFLDPTYHQQSFTFGQDGGVERMSQEQGVYKEENWTKLIGKEPFWRQTIVVGKKPKIKIIPLKEYGRTHLLKQLLYGEVLWKKYGLPEGEGVPENLFLFENGELPLDKLFRRIQSLKEQGITPENKGRYYDLRRAYLHLVEMEASRPELTDRVKDFAVLGITLQEISKESGIGVEELCINALERIGADPTGISGMRFWNPFGMPSGELFLFEVTDSLFKRILGSQN